jgi:hypothetical protein
MVLTDDEAFLARRIATTKWEFPGERSSEPCSKRPEAEYRLLLWPGWIHGLLA